MSRTMVLATSSPARARAQPGGHVKVFDGLTGAEVRSFLAFPGFTGGVFVAGGDTNKDGFGDILVGADAGGAAHVKVFDGQTGSTDGIVLCLRCRLHRWGSRRRG